MKQSGRCEACGRDRLWSIHPVRVRRWRGLTLTMLAVWGIAAAATLWQGMVPDGWSRAGLALAACYFVGLGLARAMVPR